MQLGRRESMCVYTEILSYTMVVVFGVAEWLSWVESCGYNDRRGRSVGLSLFSPFLCMYAHCIHTLVRVCVCKHLCFSHTGRNKVSCHTSHSSGERERETETGKK